LKKIFEIPFFVDAIHERKGHRAYPKFLQKKAFRSSANKNRGHRILKTKFVRIWREYIKEFSVRNERLARDSGN